VRKVDPVKHEKKRQEILAAAGRCFARDGFRGASTSDICAEANISPGHLYHYFPSKEAIIAGLTDAGLAQATEGFKRIMDAPDVLAGFLAEFERINAGRDRLIQLLLLDMLAEAGRSPELGKILRKHSAEIRAMFAEFLRKGQQQGRIDPDLDPDAAAATLLSIIDGTKALAARDPKFEVKKTIGHLKILITRFLSPPTPRSRK
jgi:TetR/AcrR family transcriptional regulator, repressor for uid operon